jgi:hypothetical protein
VQDAVDHAVDDRAAEQGSPEADRDGRGDLRQRALLRRRDRALHGRRSPRGPGQRRLHERDHQRGRRAARVRHPHAHGHLLQRDRHRGPAGRRVARGRSEHVRHAGTGRVLLRRDAGEGRTEEVPRHARRLHDVRAARAAVGADVGDGDPEPRRVRHPDEHALQGEGHPGALPAGVLLPRAGGRPRHGLPHPRLGHVHHPRIVAQQRVLLGDQPQSRRHADARLVLEDRAGLRGRVSLRARRRIGWLPAIVLAARTRDRLHRPVREPVGAP